MTIWVATKNKGKLNEFKVLMHSVPDLQFYSSSDLSAFSPPPETGKTYLENARIKTRALKAVKSKDWVIGEDSGLEIAGLGGLPGVHSAVYAGPRASDSENRSKLLKMLLLRNVTDRSATFRCTLITYTPSGEEWIFEGQMNGTIAKKESGDFGFGYDSIFIPVGQSQTLAELGPAFKNAHSHRAAAIQQFVARLKQI